MVDPRKGQPQLMEKRGVPPIHMLKQRSAGPQVFWRASPFARGPLRTPKFEPHPFEYVSIKGLKTRRMTGTDSVGFVRCVSAQVGPNELVASCRCLQWSLVLSVQASPHTQSIVQSTRRGVCKVVFLLSAADRHVGV